MRWWHTRDDGLEELLAILTTDDAVVVRASLETQIKNTWRAGNKTLDAAPRPTAARRGAALVTMAQAAQAAGLIPIVRGEHTEVVLHVDEAFLSGRSKTGMSRFTSGGSVSHGDARRVACDARITALLKNADGTTVDLGRTQRLVSDKQRRLLTARDLGCRFPGCGNTRYVDAHHVAYWANGGPTDMANLILFCNRHHRLLHHGYTIRADGDEHFTFYDRFDRPIRPPNTPAKHRCPDAPPRQQQR